MSGPPIIVMGVSGSGKTTLGAALGRRLGVPFRDGDDLHPAANVARMRAGHPLTDADRAPWLDAVAGWLAAHRGGGVIACSALKRAYRDRLREASGAAPVFVLLDPPEAVLRARLARRTGHFMPPSLLGDQLATLEPPGADERAVRVAGDGAPAALVAAILRDIGDLSTDRP